MSPLLVKLGILDGIDRPDHGPILRVWISLNPLVVCLAGALIGFLIGFRWL